MAEQVCPHCYRVITQEDLANYPLKLKEKGLRKDFLSSEVYRKHNRWFIIVFVLGLVGVSSPVILLLTNMNKGALENVKILLSMEIVFGIFTIFMVWLIYSMRKISRLEDEYVKSRLTSAT